MKLDQQAQRSRERYRWPRRRRPPGLESIDRLEEKIKLLVNTIVRIKGEQNRVARRERPPEGAKSTALKARINSAESAGAEVTTLREERDLIKSRVTDMLKQLDWPEPLTWPSPRSSRSRSTGRNTRSRPSWIPATSRSWPQFVEARMALASRSSPPSDAVGLAILTALNITDEYFRGPIRPDQQLRHPHGPGRGPRADGRSGPRSRRISLPCAARPCLFYALLVRLYFRLVKLDPGSGDLRSSLLLCS